MAYDRFDTRDGPRDQRSHWRDERTDERGWGRDSERGGQGDRGWFERAGDEIASWFGNDDDREGGRPRGERDQGWGGDHRREQHGSHRDHDDQRGGFFGRSDDDRHGRGQQRFSGPSPREMRGGRDRDRDHDRGRFRDENRGGYRPMTGDYGRSEQFFAASGTPRGGFGRGDEGRGGFGGRDDRSNFERSQSPWGRDEYRRTSQAGSSDRSQGFDPHYHSWREQQMSELDRDYDDYRRENQSRFEDDFKAWRERRQQKRGLLGQIREHMAVVGSDDEHVGTIDRVAGDRIILTKSDPESGGVHHSLGCSNIDRVEDDKVILDCTAEKAKQNWRDESRSRALFEPEGRGEEGPHMLDRSFEGTYR